LTFQWKRALMNKVRQNELDTSSLEVRIAKHTALIRHWSKLLSEMKSVCAFYLFILLLRLIFTFVETFHK
ncbi:28S ribosomal protein S15, mitochondrial, partial [Trichinella patagoniensis]